MAEWTLPEKFVCVDVQCVATGPRHDSRAVGIVAVVDKDERVLLNKKVKPVEKVYSYLTPKTGISPGDLDDGERLEGVIEEVKGLLGPDVMLVGQSARSDVEWLHLQEGVDYERTVNLGEVFKTYNPRYDNYSYFSLSHEANTLLRQGFITHVHDPIVEAKASIQLFLKYYTNSALLREAKQKLLRTYPSKSWAKKNNYRWEGVCLAAFMPDKCRCGAPTMKSMQT